MHIRITSILILLIICLSCSKDSVSPLAADVIIEEHDPIEDIEGNIYETVKIDDRIWMTENLNVGHFRNGDPILEAKSKEEWLLAGQQHTAAWCYYANDPANSEDYGKLYNWYAISDPRGLEPENWRVATDKTWSEVIDKLGGNDVAGTKMKATTGWPVNGNGDNISQFNGLPGGGRTSDGDFVDIRNAGVWWSSTEISAITARGYNIVGNSNGIFRGEFDKSTGLSIRAIYCPTCINDTTSNLTLNEKFQRVLDKSVETSNGKGISASVIMPNGDYWTGVSGISHNNIAVLPDMRFAVGSIGKMFTAVTVLQLFEEGLLGLDDALYRWLPVFPNIDSTITIRQLLNHTSGINDFADDPAYWDAIFNEPTKVWTPEEVIIAFTGEPVHDLGTDWNYSTSGYNLLRIMIMNISDTDLAKVYQERFWEPLGLSNTFTLLSDELPSEIAHGWYDLNHDGTYDDFYAWPRTAFVTGIGGEIWSTPYDLAKWMKALFYDKTILNESTLSQMLEFCSPCTGEEFTCSGYGLGVLKFNPEMINNTLAYGHGGNAPGYAASCMYLPDYKVSIAVMDNTEEGELIGACLNNLVQVLTDDLDK